MTVFRAANRPITSYISPLFFSLFSNENVFDLHENKAEPDSDLH